MTEFSRREGGGSDRPRGCPTIDGVTDSCANWRLALDHQFCWSWPHLFISFFFSSDFIYKSGWPFSLGKIGGSGQAGLAFQPGARGP